MANINIEKLNNKKVGDPVYLFADGTNMQRRFRDEPLESKIIETTVIKITKKYMTVDDKFKGIQFDRTDDYTEKTNYCADYYLYADKQDIYDLKEKANLFSELSINMRDDMRTIYGKGYYISNLYSNLAHYFANKHIEREEIMDIVRGE